MLSASLLALAVAGCAAESVGDADRDFLSDDDAKLDSFYAPTEMGVAPFGAAVAAELRSDRRYLAWEFELSGDADVKIETNGRDAISRELDTVMYLYRQNASGRWGRYIAKNDNADDDTLHLLSRIEEELGVGKYRVIVRGGSRSDLGRFNFELTCDGDGCDAPVDCALGDSYGDATDALSVVEERTVDSPEGIDKLEEQQIILALHESTHDDVTTLAQAFEAADEGLINLVDLRAVDGRVFRAVEYGAGENSYGAIFASGTTARAASIHDGDLYDCVAPRDVSAQRECQDGPAFCEVIPPECASDQVLTVRGGCFGGCVSPFTCR